MIGLFSGTKVINKNIAISKYFKEMMEHLSQIGTFVHARKSKVIIFALEYSLLD